MIKDGGAGKEVGCAWVRGEVGCCWCEGVGRYGGGDGAERAGNGFWARAGRMWDGGNFLNVGEKQIGERQGAGGGGEG